MGVDLVQHEAGSVSIVVAFESTKKLDSSDPIHQDVIRDEQELDRNGRSMAGLPHDECVACLVVQTCAITSFIVFMDDPAHYPPPIKEGLL
jgi:hypothetical protein